jgi:hypothetical protein
MLLEIPGTAWSLNDDRLSLIHLQIQLGKDLVLHSRTRQTASFEQDGHVAKQTQEDDVVNDLINALVARGRQCPRANKMPVGERGGNHSDDRSEQEGCYNGGGGGIPIPIASISSMVILELSNINPTPNFAAFYGTQFNKEAKEEESRRWCTP